MKVCTRLKWLRTGFTLDHLRYRIRPSIYITFHDKQNSQGLTSAELKKTGVELFRTLYRIPAS
jgi:hypothetical protein